MHTRVPASAGLLLSLHLLTARWDHQEFRNCNIIDLNMPVETRGFRGIHLHHFFRGRFLPCAGWHVRLPFGDNDVEAINCMSVPRWANVPLARACHWQETNVHSRLMDGKIKCSKLLSFLLLIPFWPSRWYIVEIPILSTCRSGNRIKYIWFKFAPNNRFFYL